MPTRKQVKRERKRRVHGLERGPSPVAMRSEGAPDGARKAPPVRGGRGGKPVPFPTWRRAFRRSAVILVGWAVLMAVLAFTSGDQSSLPVSLAVGVVMLSLTVPLSFLVDRSVWRSARKRGHPHEPPPPGASV